jgi:pyruvate/2-oxoglutarate dehydrogenase complex dihydrolipoamide acyltransferase (E2) component
MPRFTFNLPDIGEGIAEAEIVAWHVKVGDMISEDQPLADMMTDKATVEMESPVSGVVTKVAGEAGDVIAIGAMLVRQKRKLPKLRHSRQSLRHPSSRMKICTRRNPFSSPR